MILMYDTGARNQELLDLKLSSMHPDEFKKEGLYMRVFT
jgi:hypothetical protein